MTRPKNLKESIDVFLKKEKNENLHIHKSKRTIEKDDMTQQKDVGWFHPPKKIARQPKPRTRKPVLTIMKRALPSATFSSWETVNSNGPAALVISAIIIIVMNVRIIMVGIIGFWPSIFIVGYFACPFPLVGFSKWPVLQISHTGTFRLLLALRDQSISLPRLLWCWSTLWTSWLLALGPLSLFWFWFLYLTRKLFFLPFGAWHLAPFVDAAKKDLSVWHVERTPPKDSVCHDSYRIEVVVHLVQWNGSRIFSIQSKERKHASCRTGIKFFGNVAQRVAQFWGI